MAIFTFLLPNGTLDSISCSSSDANTEPCLTALSFASVHYFPSLPGNALYLTIFLLLLLIQLFQVVWHRPRTWAYGIVMVIGLAMEVGGYGARIGMWINPWAANPFLIYIILLTIAPVFFTAGIYLCLARLIMLYDPSNIYSRFKPSTITIGFISADFLSLVLQAVGGALADTATSNQMEQQGVNIMIAGLAFQVFSLVVFFAISVEFAVRVVKAGAAQPAGWLSNQRRSLHGFVIGLALATFFIIIRSAFRVAELNSGFGGKLANDEVSFMVLEGAMIVLATLMLTIFHPGRVLGNAWIMQSSKSEFIESGNRSDS